MWASSKVFLFAFVADGNHTFGFQSVGKSEQRFQIAFGGSLVVLHAVAHLHQQLPSPRSVASTCIRMAAMVASSTHTSLLLSSASTRMATGSAVQKRGCPWYGFPTSLQFFFIIDHYKVPGVHLFDEGPSVRHAVWSLSFFLYGAIFVAADAASLLQHIYYVAHFDYVVSVFFTTAKLTI